MKLGSLFDGSGGFPLAGAINGMNPVWASEIEPYPIRVTEARFPNMKHLGDVTKIDGAAIEPVDVITFGSPCQDLSVAGKQAGIHSGERSNLFFEAIRIIKEMREHERCTGRADKHIRPRFAVWENVPGTFSSNKGADFQAVLQALCEITDASVSVPLPEKGKWQKAGCIVGDGYSIAWRVYDAQFWGVPQRRKRIYLVADFGSERAGEILFERESVCRNTTQSREAWERTTADAEGGNGRSGDDGRLTCGVLYALEGNGSRDSHQGDGWKETETMFTLNTVERHGVVYEIDALSSGSTKSSNQIVVFGKELYNSGANCTGGHYVSENGMAPTLRTSAPPGIVYSSIAEEICADTKPEINIGQDAINSMFLAVKADTLPRKYIVRRLTPLECCRLQGFPDWWEDGVEGSDSARYKMWGNGIALPCAVDVLGRIAKVQR